MRSTLKSRFSPLHSPEEHPGKVVAPGRIGRDRFHVAIIMDGNGRWAEARGRPRTAGHVAGTAAVRRAVESAPELGITTLTLYAFSSDNWRRPRSEVVHLMRLFQTHLRAECTRMVDRGVRFRVIGRRDRLPRALCRRIESVEEQTRLGETLQLRVAIDYSARDALLAAANRLHATPSASRADFERAMAEVIHAGPGSPASPGCSRSPGSPGSPGSPDVDLLIRTGGEQRLSDFLLWECAYAELYFTGVLWPDFRAADLARAVRAFTARDRRYGGLSADAAPIELPDHTVRRTAP